MPKISVMKSDFILLVKSFPAAAIHDTPINMESSLIQMKTVLITWNYTAKY
jgi:hypothetical protein